MGVRAAILVRMADFDAIQKGYFMTLGMTGHPWWVLILATVLTEMAKNLSEIQVKFHPTKNGAALSNCPA
jgi:hypothetical protein